MTTKKADTAKDHRAAPKHETKYEPGHTGAVKDPAHDGRLKANRDSGTTLGTTEHSAQAPNAATK